MTGVQVLHGCTLLSGLGLSTMSAVDTMLLRQSALEAIDPYIALHPAEGLDSPAALRQAKIYQQSQASLARGSSAHNPSERPPPSYALMEVGGEQHVADVSYYLRVVPAPQILPAARLLPPLWLAVCCLHLVERIIVVLLADTCV